MRCKIKKILNNNVILVDNYYGNEAILIGRGLGYKIKAGDYFDNFEKINQVFTLSNKNSFDTLLNNVNNELIALVEEEIHEMQNVLKTKVNENFHVTLIDHIAFAINRYEKGLTFNNPFNQDLAILYESEYQLAKKMVERINEEFHVKLADDEVGIIAIHIHAAYSDEKIEISRRKTALIEKMINDIYAEFKMNIQKNSLSHQRLLIHVHYAVERILSNQVIENNMMDYVVENYNDYFIRIQKIMKLISKEYQIDVPDSEVSYLVIHFVRIQNELEKNG